MKQFRRDCFAALAMTMALHEARLIERGADERGEERVRLEWARFELGVELHADVPGVIGKLDDLRQNAVRRHARKPEPGFFEALLVTDIDLVPMAMALADAGGAVDLRHSAFRREHRFVGAQPQRPAWI